VGFRPEAVNLTEQEREALLTSDDPSQALRPETITADHAFDILSSIPLADHERRHARDTARYVIHFDDPMHGTIVWGLICTDSPTINVRWRHRMSRSLERATEEFVTRVWGECRANRANGLFEPFSSGQSIPVREPRMTTDAYVGHILPPGPRRKELAKEHKKTELRIAQWTFFITILCFIAGFLTFSISSPNDTLRWFSGAFDRLATAGAATSVVSYLSYYFYFRDIKSKPSIDWQ